MLLLRVLGVISLLVASIALVADGTKTLASKGGMVTTPMAQQWAELSPDSLAATQNSVEGSSFPWLWDPVLVGLMQAPTWAVFGLLGIALYWIGRKKQRLEVYIN
jgi:hypothetical protein